MPWSLCGLVDKADTFSLVGSHKTEASHEQAAVVCLHSDRH